MRFCHELSLTAAVDVTLKVTDVMRYPSTEQPKESRLKHDSISHDKVKHSPLDLCWGSCERMEALECGSTFGPMS